MKKQKYKTKSIAKSDQNQYDFLMDCVKKGNISEWNNWRKENPEQVIWLSGADLNLLNLSGINLSYAHLEGAKMFQTNLEGASLYGAYLNQAYLSSAILCGVMFECSNMRGLRARGAVFDGFSHISYCLIDKKTDFTGAGLENARIDPGLKQLLEYNIRRIGWHEWYEKDSKYSAYKFIKKIFIQPFWQMSDYGRSTLRIILSFIVLALAFGSIYFFEKVCFDNDVIANLTTNNIEKTNYLLLLVRSMYFSIVTMTTLGFGDMYAESQSILGHILLTVQVLLGYILLGVLITRFAVLFTTWGPPKRFKDYEEMKRCKKQVE